MFLPSEVRGLWLDDTTEPRFYTREGYKRNPNTLSQPHHLHRQHCEGQCAGLTLWGNLSGFAFKGPTWSKQLRKCHLWQKSGQGQTRSYWRLALGWGQNERGSRHLYLCPGFLKCTSYCINRLSKESSSILPNSKIPVCMKRHTFTCALLQQGLGVSIVLSGLVWSTLTITKAVRKKNLHPGGSKHRTHARWVHSTHSIPLPWNRRFLLCPSDFTPSSIPSPNRQPVYKLVKKPSTIGTYPQPTSLSFYQTDYWVVVHS